MLTGPTNITKGFDVKLGFAAHKHAVLWCPAPPTTKKTRQVRRKKPSQQRGLAADDDLVDGNKQKLHEEPNEAHYYKAQCGLQANLGVLCEGNGSARHPSTTERVGEPYLFYPASCTALPIARCSWRTPSVA
jgi:hypothetical protein